MKIKKVLLAVLLLIMAGTFTLCSKKGDGDCLDSFNIVHDESASIVGKWQLIKSISSGFGAPVTCTDFSQFNIVYEFKSNKVVVISVKIDHPEIWPKAGEYTYSLGDDNNGSMGGLPYRLRISEHNTYWYQLNSQKLIMDNRPLDGEALLFIKIN